MSMFPDLSSIRQRATRHWAVNDTTTDPVKPPLVRIWDLPVRLFHWSVVVLIAISWVSADNGYMRVHYFSGLSLLVLVLFRLVWGFVGSTTARFVAFVRRPRAVLAYLRASRADVVHHPGHNPAGALMVVALLLALLLQAVTGLFANDGVRFSGPLALLISSDGSDLMTRIHALIFNGILLFVWLHVVAVFFHLLVKRENLIRPMITGLKERAILPDMSGLELRFGSNRLAILILAMVVGLVAIIVL